MRAAGLLELPHHEGAGARGAAPVHVATVVAGHVLAQRVERQVRVRDLAGLATLEVVQEPGGRAADRDRARVHVEVLGLGPQHRAADQPERVAAHRGDRTHRDDAATLGGDREQLVVLGAGTQRRQREGRARRADRQLDARGQHPPVADVGHLDRAHRPLADDDTALPQPQPHPVGVAAHRERDRADDEGEQPTGDDDRLQPAEALAHDQREHPRAEHDPAGAADPAEHRRRPLDALDQTRDDARHRPGAGGPRDRRRCGGRRGGRARGGHRRAQASERCAGGGISPRMRCTDAIVVPPSNSASASSTMRCASTGSASSLTSSGMT